MKNLRLFKNFPILFEFLAIIILFCAFYAQM